MAKNAEVLGQLLSDIENHIGELRKFLHKIGEAPQTETDASSLHRAKYLLQIYNKLDKEAK